MAEQVLSLVLTVLLMWAGRDTGTWTPKFKGTPEERFNDALIYYQAKMGLTGDYVVEVQLPRKRIAGVRACAWTYRAAEWQDVDVIGYAQAEACDRFPPELRALHEQCHRRLAHLDMPRLTTEQKEREVKTCMGWYSAKERR